MKELRNIEHISGSMAFQNTSMLAVSSECCIDLHETHYCVCVSSEVKNEEWMDVGKKV